MKVAIILLGLISLACSAPQPRKLFHEHVEDFMDVITAEAGHDLEHIMEHYLEFEEFKETLDYIKTNNFKDLVYEMESLPEFNAVIEFLENDNIDIHYFLDLINNMFDYITRMKKLRHTVSGTDFSAYIQDSINEFPKQKLAELFEQKKAEDDDFRTAVENLESDEWDQTFSALWSNEVFQKEVQTLADNGIEVDLVLTEIKAIFGQN